MHKKCIEQLIHFYYKLSYLNQPDELFKYYDRPSRHKKWHFFLTHQINSYTNHFYLTELSLRKMFMNFQLKRVQ